MLAHRKKVNIDGINVLYVSLEDKLKLENQVIQLAPDVIIHAAGLTNVEKCEIDRYMAISSNVVTSRILLKFQKRKA